MPGALCHVGSEGDIKHYENAKGLRNLQSSFFVLHRVLHYVRQANIIESEDNIVHTYVRYATTRFLLKEKKHVCQQIIEKNR